MKPEKDAKLLAVPTINKLFTLYEDIESCEDLPQLILSQIAHFFAHYKNLEKGKWVKIQGWDGFELAKTRNPGRGTTLSRNIKQTNVLNLMIVANSPNIVDIVEPPST